MQPSPLSRHTTNPMALATGDHIVLMASRLFVSSTSSAGSGTSSVCDRVIRVGRISGSPRGPRLDASCRRLRSSSSSPVGPWSVICVAGSFGCVCSWSERCCCSVCARGHSSKERSLRLPWDPWPGSSTCYLGSATGGMTPCISSTLHCLGWLWGGRGSILLGTNSGDCRWFLR